MPNAANVTPLINIDSAMKPLSEAEITAEVIEARVCSLAFQNFDAIDRRLPFVLELCTGIPSSWQKLLRASEKSYWIEPLNHGVLVFEASQDCGCIRTYRFRGRPSFPHAAPEVNWMRLRNEGALYDLLDTPAASAVYDAWIVDKTRATDLPTVLVNGRLQNTSVEKAFIFSKGNGCVVCGLRASCYAATTVGTSDAALLIQLPVCREHLDSAKQHPSIFCFLASLFHLSLDWPDLAKHDAIPDNLISAIHEAAALGLSAVAGTAEKRERGWHLWLNLDSGWKWLLRLNTMTDYAYMLFEPNKKPERYRADSAPDDPDLPFFPNHEHGRPSSKSDQVTPSFLYGHPLFDLKRLKSAGVQYGAY